MTAPNPISEYLDVFNLIEQRLKRIGKVGARQTFSQALDAASDKDASVKLLADRLRLDRNLRNVIIHNGLELAEPLKSTLEGIRSVLASLERPQLVVPAYELDVVTCGPDDGLGSVAAKMAREDFTALPVYESDRVVGVMSTSAISRWLGLYADGRAELSTPVSEVMRFDEYPTNWRVIKSDATLGRALALFTDAHGAGQPLYFALITEDGNHRSAPLGIITAFDVPLLVQKIKAI